MSADAMKSYQKPDMQPLSTDDLEHVIGGGMAPTDCKAGNAPTLLDPDGCYLGSQDGADCSTGSSPIGRCSAGMKP